MRFNYVDQANQSPCFMHLASAWCQKLMSFCPKKKKKKNLTPAAIIIFVKNKMCIICFLEI